MILQGKDVILLAPCKLRLYIAIRNRVQILGFTQSDSSSWIINTDINELEVTIICGGQGYKTSIPVDPYTDYVLKNDN